MIYAFNCDYCNSYTELDARAFHPPKAPACECGMEMQRAYGCHIDTSGCKDVDFVPEKFRTPVSESANLTPAQTAAIERRHQKHTEQTRRDLVGGNRGAQRLTHQIPAALHAAKIKETGDPKYWDDPKNRNRHKSTRVDK